MEYVLINEIPKFLFNTLIIMKFQLFYQTISFCIFSINGLSIAPIGLFKASFGKSIIWFGIPIKI